MKVLFNPVPEQYKEQGEHFVCPTGNEFYYQLEVEFEEDGNGHFRIEDTCGRMLPFDFESLDDLILILQKLRATRVANTEYRERISEASEDLTCDIACIWGNK